MRKCRYRRDTDVLVARAASKSRGHDRFFARNKVHSTQNKASIEATRGTMYGDARRSGGEGGVDARSTLKVAALAEDDARADDLARDTWENRPKATVR